MSSFEKHSQEHTKSIQTFLTEEGGNVTARDPATTHLLYAKARHLLYSICSPARVSAHCSSPRSGCVVGYNEHQQ